MTSETIDPKIITYFDKQFKWSIASLCEMDGDMPLVKGSKNIPKCLVSFKDIKKRYWDGSYIHFFQNDYQFDGERGIWFDTIRHVPALERFRGVLSPDFSLYKNAGRIPQLWNTYRNRLVQCHLERLGFDVIPTVSWGLPETYDFCFKGLPKESVVAVSTLGVMKSREAISTFEDGYQQMCAILNPSTVVIYGSTRNLSLGSPPYISFKNATYNWTEASRHEGVTSNYRKGA